MSNSEYTKKVISHFIHKDWFRKTIANILNYWLNFDQKKAIAQGYSF